jgi:hypothetical protein
MNRLRAFFRNHGEKVGLVATLALLGAYLLFGVALSGGETVGGRYARRVAFLRERMGASAPPAREPVTAFSEAKRAWNEPVAPPEGVSDWTSYRPPIVLATLGSPPAPKRHIGDPELEKPHREFGKIALKWRHSASTDLDIVEGHRVFRRVKGQKDWEKIRDLPPSEMEFEDTGVKPKTDYEYYVETWAKPSRDIDRDTGRSNVQAVTTLSTTQLELVLVAGDIARIRVKILYSNEWVEQVFNVKKGDMIGEPNRTITLSDGRREVVDFRTGCRVGVIRMEEYTDWLEGFEMVPDPTAPGGLRKVPRRTPVKKQRPVVGYYDEEGKKQILRPVARKEAAPAPDDPPAGPQ